MRRLILILPLLLTSCGSLAVQEDPATGEAIVVDTATGQRVEVVEAAGAAATAIGGLFGMPAIGAAVAAIAAGVLTRRAKAKA